MSVIPCPNCGESTETTAGACARCGAPVEDIGAAPTSKPAGLHGLAPLVFAIAAIGVGAVTTAVSSLALGIPIGLLGGGIGVWMLERGRRML